MAQISVKYNPYILETELLVNGNAIATDSSIYTQIKGKRLQEWIGAFPEEIKNELNSRDFDVEFYGMKLDWDDFEFAFRQAKNNGVIKNLSLKFVEGKSNDDIQNQVIDLFHKLHDGPLDDFRDANLERKFEDIRSEVFPVNVIATMSSGKSTLINALLSHKLMPSKNMACTATITEITDNDSQGFNATVYNHNEDFMEEIQNLTYEEMERLNDNKDVHRILINGDIPFIDANSTVLRLVDTPGPNNSQNQQHKNTTYGAVNSDAKNLILYVLNTTQLATDDDANLLDYVAEQIKHGGKIVRDRFLFIINKMDECKEGDNIEKILQSTRDYLAEHGIIDPQIFPCSAFAALNIRTLLDNVDVDNITRAEMKKLSSDARDTITMIDKFMEHKPLHLEQYSVLSPSTKSELDYHLLQAVERQDTKEQALIHSGIYSIEAAITAYVKKYAKTKKIKDLVESFQEIMESSKVLLSAKDQVANSEELAKEAIKRANNIRAIIQNGEEARKFEEQLNAYNPMAAIERKAEELEDKIIQKASRFFSPYGNKIESKGEAERIIRSFANTASDAIAELSAELDSVIHHELMDTGEHLLEQYQEKLMRFDDNAGGQKLDFSTADLIKGALQNMKKNADSWGADEFISSTIDDVGDVSQEQREYYVKTGEREKEVADGTEDIKIGTRKVENGSHREYRGTKRVKNKDKSWWQFWKDSYVDEDVYEMVTDYKDEDVYKTVIKYKKVKEDIFEKRIDVIEKFSVDVTTLQTGLLTELRMNVARGTKDAARFAEEEIHRVKARFIDLFAELDKKIAQKYEELETFAADQKNKEEELARNRELLVWIEARKEEMKSILGI